MAVTSVQLEYGATRFIKEMSHIYYHQYKVSLPVYFFTCYKQAKFSRQNPSLSIICQHLISWYLCLPVYNLYIFFGRNI